MPDGLDMLQATFDFLAEAGHCGIVWVRPDLVAVSRYGVLAEVVPLEARITDSVPALMGLEDDITALQHDETARISLPNLNLDAGRFNSRRVNLALYWRPALAHYFLIFSEAASHHEFEVALTAQIRARSIAEAEIAAKSREIAKANEELTRANADLDAFASIVSHDLRSPLRRLTYFAGEAQTAIAQGETGEALDNLSGVRSQARRMATMLTGLLEYARCGRKPDAAGFVETRDLIEEIAASANRGELIEIRIGGDWPRILTPAQSLDIVLRNLIENAIKHHDRAYGAIYVTGHDEAEIWRVTVADDGPGIAEAWQAAIFEPFRRISGGEAATDGAGIGLALVKRTLETIGGRVTVHSEPAVARGTTFCVEWPKILTQ